MDNERHILDALEEKLAANNPCPSSMSGYIPDAGYERDKLIGKLRGNKVLQAKDIGSYYYDKTCKHTIHIASWSTDRCIVWQLWDELPAKKWVEEYPNECICAAWESHNMKKYSGTGKNFTDAVSIAWLRMKGI